MSKLCLANGSAGTPCKRRIRDDEKRCRFHGGASPQARRAARERALVSAVTRDAPVDARRDPRVILLDSVQQLDELVRRGALDGTAAHVEHLVTVIKMAKIVCDAGVAERLTAQRERDLEAEGELLVRALVGVVDPLLAHLPIADVQREAWRRWAYASAIAALHGVPGPQVPAAQPAVTRDASLALVLAERPPGDVEAVSWPRPARS